MKVINHDFERPDSKLIERLAKFATPNISDALVRFGGMAPRIKPAFKGAKMAGPAYTVLNYPKDNLMTHYALKHAKAGDVLVVDNHGASVGSGWGELMSTAAKVKGLAGLVVDGPVRDLSALKEIGFPVFSSGIMAEGTVKVTPGSVNCPVCCGDQAVSPGDIILGDEDGVVVVPARKLEEVLKTAETIEEKESVIKQRIMAGETIYDILNLGQYLEP